MARADETGSSPVGSETLLLVEDEPSLRSVVASSLRDHGYRVLEAPNGEEALRLVDNSETPIDLLLTDMVMPLMSGRELVDRLEVEHPGVRIVYMSGYRDAMKNERLQEASAEFIQKPFTAEELQRRLRAALDQPETASIS